MYKISYEDGTSLESRSLPEILNDTITKFTWTKEHIGFKLGEFHHAKIREIITIFDQATGANTKLDLPFGIITVGKSGILYGDYGPEDHTIWLREWTE